jgi:RNA recognition motif-containing protein
MAYKIYVGNLAYATDDAGLKAAFEEYGTVESASVVLDKYTGRSRGFGFVEMATQEEGEAAVKAMDGKELDGRELRVNEARPKEQ